MINNPLLKNYHGQSSCTLLSGAFPSPCQRILFNKVFLKTQSMAAPLPELGINLCCYRARQPAARLLTLPTRSSTEVPWRTLPTNKLGSTGDTDSHRLTSCDCQTLREQKSGARV